MKVSVNAPVESSIKPIVKTHRLQLLVDHLSVEIVDSEEGLFALADEWTVLWQRCPHATPYQSFSWHASIWATSSKKVALAVCIVRENGHVVGIAPFVSQRKLGIDALEPMGSNHYAYFGLIVEGQRGDIAQVLAQGLAARYPKGTIHIPYYVVSQQDMAAMLAALSALGWGGATWVRNVSHFVRHDGDLASYLAMKSSKSRSTLKRKRRVLEEVGPVELKVFGGSSLDGEVLSRIVTLQKRSWLWRRGQESFEDRDFQKILLGMSKGGLSEIYMLTVNGQDVAYMWNYTANGKNYLNTTGFDESWEKCSPGTVLMWMVLDRLLSRGDQCFDFLFGDASYKEFWANRTNHVLRTVVWHGFRGWILSIYPHRIHGFVTRRDWLRQAARRVRRLFSQAKGLKMTFAARSS